MRRLNTDTLHGFLAEPGVALVLFGAPTGRPTMAQAEAFAHLWADECYGARFGYIDATTNELARHEFAIRVLPTTLVFLDGDCIARFEGFHARERLESAARNVNCARAEAA